MTLSNLDPVKAVDTGRIQKFTCHSVFELKEMDRVDESDIDLELIELPLSQQGAHLNSLT